MTHLVGLLKDDPVFSHLTEEHLKELAGLAMQRSFQTDEVVCLQGDSWPYTFYIVDGSLRSVISAPDGRNFVGSTWGRGDVFWAPTLFDDEPMPSTLEAVTSTSIYLWRGEDALEQVLRNPNAVRALLRRQTQIIRQRRQGIYGLAFNPLASRLAQLLVDRIFISGEPTVQRDLTLEARSNPELWAACIAGALVESELPVIAAQSGLIDGHVVRRFNCFYDTTAEAKVAKDLFIQSVNFHARKPDSGTSRQGFLF